MPIIRGYFIWGALLFLRPQHHDHLPTFHLRLLLDDAKFGQVGLHPTQQFQSQLSVGMLTTTETHRDLGLVTLIEEARQVAQLDLIVSDIGTGTEFDLLDLNLLLLLARLGLLLFLVEPEAAVIHQTADRWIGVGHDLDQVERLRARPGQRRADINNPDLISIRADQSDFRDRDVLVDAVTFWCSDSRLLQ
jgi:hypothetical protein